MPRRLVPNWHIYTLKPMVLGGVFQLSTFYVLFFHGHFCGKNPLFFSCMANLFLPYRRGHKGFGNTFLKARFPLLSGFFGYIAQHKKSQTQCFFYKKTPGNSLLHGSAAVVFFLVKFHPTHKTRGATQNKPQPKGAPKRSVVSNLNKPLNTKKASGRKGQSCQTQSTSRC